jgi:Sec-independent protein translocase protein TatA
MGISEMLVIAVVILVFIGARNVSKIAKHIGKKIEGDDPPAEDR